MNTPFDKLDRGVLLYFSFNILLCKLGIKECQVEDDFVTLYHYITKLMMHQAENTDPIP